jgi:hypothetical protein
MQDGRLGTVHWEGTGSGRRRRGQRELKSRPGQDGKEKNCEERGHDECESMETWAVFDFRIEPGPGARRLRAACFCRPLYHSDFQEAHIAPLAARAASHRVAKKKEMQDISEAEMGKPKVL